MSWHLDCRVGHRLAVGELRRSVRAITADRRRLAELFVIGASVGLPVAIVLPVVVRLGRTATANETGPVLAEWATLATIGLFVFVVFRTVSSIGGIDASSLVLTSVHPRAVVIALMSAEIVRQGAVFGGLCGLLLGAFGVGAGVPWLGLTGAILALPIVCWTVVWGYTAGVGLLVLDDRLQFDRRLLAVGGTLTLVAVIVVTIQLTEHPIGGPFVIGQNRFVVAPLGEYATLALAGTALAQPAGVGALGTVGFLVVSVPVGVPIASKLARRHWLRDVAPSTTSAADSIVGVTPPAPFGWTPAGSIAWGHLVRAIRQPRRHAHVLTALVAIAPLASMVADAPPGEVGGLVGLFGVILATVTAGLLFVLNPIGEVQEQLPLVLLTGTSPETLVRARVVAATTVGVIVLCCVGLIAVLLGIDPLWLAVVLVLGSAFCLASALFSVGLGTAMPSTDITEQWGIETVTPSLGASIVFLFTVWDGATIGAGATWLVATGWIALSPVVLVAFCCYGVLVIGPAIVSYRSAVRRFSELTIEEVRG